MALLIDTTILCTIQFTKDTRVEKFAIRFAKYAGITGSDPSLFLNLDYRTR